jgi:hypothetical protein
MKRLALICSVALLVAVVVRFSSRGASGPVLYDADPGNAWNQLYKVLFIRTDAKGREFGTDSLDLLYWSATRHLLEGDSATGATQALDQFLNQHGEKLISDPLKRAILQRDLWALFDWAAARSVREHPQIHLAAVSALNARLAEAIRRVALTKQQIDALPDNYAAAAASKTYPPAFDPTQPDSAFLPPDLFAKDGPWVCVEMQSYKNLPAPVHTEQFGGRSAFLVFMKLPGGRADTLAYISKLNQFPELLILDISKAKEIYRAHGLVLPLAGNPEGPWMNPGIPQFPAGTSVALVRQAILLDDQGNLTSTHLTESVQFRVYRTIERTIGDNHPQSTFEFELSRANLFAGNAGGLRAIGKDEKGFTKFLSMGIDPFENPSAGPGTLMNCTNCHYAEGIQSVLSHNQNFASQPMLNPPKYTESTPERMRDATQNWKQDQYDWGNLNGFWQQSAAQGH